MHKHHPHYPWIFHRDDIDLLEDELEDLYERFGRNSQETKTFESLVLSEQMETEERSDARLEQRLGTGSLMQISESPISSEEISFGKTQDQELALFVRNHPLYQKAKIWAGTLRPLAERGYEEGGLYASEYFRIFANVNLIPLKLFAALSEELHEDRLSLDVARELYGLCVIYLDRIQESLGFILFGAQDVPWLEVLLREARQMRDLVRRHAEELGRFKGIS